MTAQSTVKRIAAVARLLMTTLSTIIFAASCAFASPGVTLDVRAENRTILVPGPGDGTIQIQVIAPDAPVRHDRPRLNLALVIDRSGSMAGARKLEFVKTAAHNLIDMMGPDDILSIVTYDDRIDVPWRAAKIDGNRDRLHAIVSNIYPGGSTFLSGGLDEGFRQAESGRRRGYVNRVLLLSDGLANVGVVNRGEIRGIASNMMERGVTVSTFGVGNDFDEELMAGAASSGGGNYRYLGDPEQIVAALSGEFNLAARTAASDVEIIIRLRRDCRFGSVLGREWRREGDAYIIRLGNLSAGERRTVFANLGVSADRTGLREVGDVSIRYRDPATEKMVNASAKTISVEVTRDEKAHRAGFDRDVQEKRAIAESSVKVQEAARLADAGKKDEAKAMLGAARSVLSAAPASPAVKAEAESAARYGQSLDATNDMGSEKAKEMQKSIKYRSYETLNQK